MNSWQRFLLLFAPAGQVPPPMNRKDRRTRKSIARRQPIIPVIEEEDSEDQ